jgi:hypothetical protein
VHQIEKNHDKVDDVVFRVIHIGKIQ